MTRVFVFTNHKGGTAKSTSSTNSAYGIVSMLRHAGAANSRVLLIDTDSQAHATLVTTGTKNYGADDSLYTVLMADRPSAAQTLLNCIIPSTWDEDLHVLPASPMLEGAERELMGLAGAPYRLSDPLNQLASRYAAVVLDPRPSFSLITDLRLLPSTHPRCQGTACRYLPKQEPQEGHHKGHEWQHRRQSEPQSHFRLAQALLQDTSAARRLIYAHHILVQF